MAINENDLGMLISVVKSIPDTAAAAAVEAAEQAAASAEAAAESAYAISVTGTTLNILDNGGE